MEMKFYAKQYNEILLAFIWLNGDEKLLDIDDKTSLSICHDQKYHIFQLHIANIVDKEIFIKIIQIPCTSQQDLNVTNSLASLYESISEEATVIVFEEKYLTQTHEMLVNNFITLKFEKISFKDELFINCIFGHVLEMLNVD